MRGLHLRNCAIVAIAIALLSSPTLRADVSGAVLGTVTDPSGAAVPGAKVTLRNSDTGLVRTTTTDSVGGYEFLAVPVGKGYMLSVEAAGFQKLDQTDIKLLVNQKYRADISLKVGSLAKAVTVSAQAAQVETSNTHVGDVIEGSKISAVPLNGRSFIDLLGLQAGVVPITSDVAMTQGVAGQTNAGNVSVNGQRESANTFVVNGGTVEHSYNNGTSVVPVLDSIQEFRLLTNSFDAEYGRFSGAVVNVVTKSGSNDLHGSGFEFLRNDKLDSRNFFDYNQVDLATDQQIPGSALGKLERNQFGGTLGGPIKKNLLFFFVDYQGTREIRGVSSGNITVPSQSERNGDFSDVGTTGYHPLTGTVNVSAPSSGTMDQVLSQRLGYAVAPGEPYWVPGCATLSDARAGKCVFPGQVIPQSAWSPAAKGTLGFIPSANLTANGVPYFSTSAERSDWRDDKFGVRIDLNSQRTGNWSFYYHFDDTTVTSPYGGGNLPGFPSQAPTRDQQINASNTHTFGPSAVNEARLNYTRSVYTAGFPAGGLGDISQWGFTKGGLGIIPGVPSLEGVPSMSLGLLGLSFGAANGVTKEPNNIFQAADNFSRIWGRHTAKFGVDGRYIQLNIRQNIEQNGSFQFFGNETGNDFADFLIGAPTTYGQASPGFEQDARAKYFGTYAQDSFKLRSNLTINYGLRYEISQPFYDRYNRVQAFVPGLQSHVFPDSPEAWVYPTDGGLPPTLSHTQYTNFGPRIGIAYSPGFSDGLAAKVFGGPGKTSIRAAYGIYYTTIEEAPLLFETGDAPFGLFYVSPALVYLEEPFKSRTSSNDPGQRFPIPPVPPTGSNVNFSTWMPVSGSTIVKTDNVLPRTQHLNFSIQRQVNSSTILTLSYVGSQGHHLVSQIEANSGIPSLCMHIANLFAAASLAGGCGPFGEDQIYTINGQTFYGTRPYSVTSGRHLAQGLLDFGGTLPYAATSANSNYNSFQATLEKRAGALRFLGSYTWSKSMDNSSGFGDATNPYDYRASKSLSSFDMTHNFVFSYTYDLPFAHLLNARSGALYKALDGWSVNGITRFTTGLGIGVIASGDHSLCGCFGSSYNGVDLPDYNNEPIQFFDPRKTANNQYFSPDPFSVPANGTFGTANRRFFHGPGLNNWDLALLKRTSVTERVSLEFRAELFNVFNHAQFRNPASDASAPNFGQVILARDPRIGQLALQVHF